MTHGIVTGRPEDIGFVAQPFVAVEQGRTSISKEDLRAFRNDPQHQPLSLGEDLRFVLSEGSEIVQDIRRGLLRATGKIVETDQTADVWIQKPTRRGFLSGVLRHKGAVHVSYNTPSFSDAKEAQ